MYYFKIKEDSIVKCQVNLDVEKLRQLRTEIIENCSQITHEKYETTKLPIQTEHIKNYHEKKLDKPYKTEKDRIIEMLFGIVDIDTYLVEYDYYHYHKLVELIDRLLEGNTYVIKIIEDMRNTQLDEEDLTLKQSIVYYENNIQYQQQYYSNKVLDCIDYRCSENIALKSLLEVQEFLKEGTESTMDLELNKIITLRKQN